MLPLGGSAVIPEAAVVDLVPATPGTRVPARILDLLIEVAGASLVLAAAGALGGAGASETVLLVVGSVLVVVVIFAYPACCEGFWRGFTPGKAAFGLRVVTTAGAPIGWRQAIIRAVLFPFDLVAGIPSMVGSRRHQRLGDLVAATMVVRIRTAAQGLRVSAWTVPYGYEAVARSLDVTAMTGEEYELVRAYLLRWYELSSGPRWTLAADLGRLLVERMHHAVPEWVRPDIYLTCLAAAYQHHRGAAAPGYGAPGYGSPGYGAPQY